MSETIGGMDGGGGGKSFRASQCDFVGQMF